MCCTGCGGCTTKQQQWQNNVSNGGCRAIGTLWNVVSGGGGRGINSGGWEYVVVVFVDVMRCVWRVVQSQDEWMKV